MKEKGNLIFVIVAFVLGVLITSLCFIVFSKECEVCKECEKCASNEEKAEGEFTLDEEKMFNLLNDIAKDIYEKKEYINLNKNEEGIYYATFPDLSNLSYDVSDYLNCDQKRPMIFFDIEHKMADKYEREPLQISVSCEPVK